MNIESADAISRGFSPQTSANELRVEVYRYQHSLNRALICAFRYLLIRNPR